MARLHCETHIKPVYVREVCRLLATSNVQIVKGDVYVEDTTAALAREQNREVPDLAAPAPEPAQQESNVVKLSYDEYERLFYMIVKVFKDFEEAG